jgi:hypothetical protein
MRSAEYNLKVLEKYPAVLHTNPCKTLQRHMIVGLSIKGKVSVQRNPNKTVGAGLVPARVFGTQQSGQGQALPLQKKLGALNVDSRLRTGYKPDWNLSKLLIRSVDPVSFRFALMTSKARFRQAALRVRHRQEP